MSAFTKLELQRHPTDVLLDNRVVTGLPLLCVSVPLWLVLRDVFTTEALRHREIPLPIGSFGGAL